jgi:hypothetical protein
VGGGLLAVGTRFLVEAQPVYPFTLASWPSCHTRRTCTHTHTLIRTRPLTQEHRGDVEGGVQGPGHVPLIRHERCRALVPVRVRCRRGCSACWGGELWLIVFSSVGPWPGLCSRALEVATLLLLLLLPLLLLPLPPVPRYISYPRTESSAYPSSFDVREVVEKQAGHPVWGAYVRTLLATGGMQVGANQAGVVVNVNVNVNDIRLG